ncbi:hypothetical protein SynRS9909_01757 [Synechococcus sp. RS9909]|nr:hypothetical protein RS9917_11166 [Synechococcus sp. RS9917]QNI79740.1 hypothetical protein SynRS9909_01757 [Synechococcus sp. RS9909]
MVKQQPRMNKRRTASASAASGKGPATALRQPSATGVSSPVVGRLARPRTLRIPARYPSDQIELRGIAQRLALFFRNGLSADQGLDVVLDVLLWARWVPASDGVLIGYFDAMRSLASLRS